MAPEATQKFVAYNALALLVCAPMLALCQSPPPNYSYDALPETSFSCEGRAVGGYYADVEAGCQMFHVCGTSQRTSFRFLCPNDTVFDQQHLICANWFQVRCDQNTLLYSRNFEIFKNNVENEVQFNEIDEDDLPSLEDYDYDFRSSVGGAGRFFSSAGRSLISSAVRDRVTRPPVVRTRVTPRPVTAAPPAASPPNDNGLGTSRPVTSRPRVTSRPQSRRPVTTTTPPPPRPRVTSPRFDQTTAATTQRPSFSSRPVSFRDRSTFASATTTESSAGRDTSRQSFRDRSTFASATTTESSAGRDTSRQSFRDRSTFASGSNTASSVGGDTSRQIFLPTPLPPLAGDRTSASSDVGFRPTRLPVTKKPSSGFRPTRLPVISSSSSSGSISTTRRTSRPSSNAAAFSPGSRSPSRVAPGEFRSTTASPVRTASARVTAGEFRSTTASPVRTASARVTAGEFRSTTTPRPVASSAANVGGISTFSTPRPVFTTTGVFPFGFTSVPRQNFAFGTGGSFSFGTNVRNRNGNGGQSSARTSDTGSASSPQAPSPTVPTDFTQGNDVSIDDTATTTSRPFRSQNAQSQTTAPLRAVAVSSAAPFFRQTPTQQPTEPTRTVNPVAGRFFGANVVPSTTPTEARPTPAPARPRGRGRNPFRLADSDDNDSTQSPDRSATETTTSPPGGRFSATIPTRSPSTRLSSSAGAVTTLRPRGSPGRVGRRRRPSTSFSTSTATTGTAAVTSRRRGGRRQGGARRGQTNTERTINRADQSSASVAVSSDAASSGSQTASSASPSARPTVQQQVQRQQGTDSSRPAAVPRGSARARPFRPSARPTAASSDEFRNEVDDTPSPTTTSRPRPRARGRGSRRFDPRLPGGKLNPGKFIRTGRRRDDSASGDISRADLARGGLARPRRPVSPPIRAEFQQELAALTDELGLNEDELELTEEELELIQDELNSIEDSAEQQQQQQFLGADANNRSIDSSAGRRRQGFRGTTVAPVPRRVTGSSRQNARTIATTTPAPPQSSTPLVIRKKIRVRGRPSRRPTLAPVVLRRRATRATTTTAPPVEVSTLPTNKEATNLGRQNGFFLRPKLQLSSALPIDLQTRRLNDVNSLAAERTGRSRNTSPIAFNRAVRSTTLSTPLDERLSDILFASTSPGSERPPSRPSDSDYDYEYFDSDFRSEHAGLLAQSEGLFQALSRKTRSA